ncbi:hypothetical protein [Salinisphaera sp. G21_0]|uniref:hypothetical protein n=1 Tax=Salinisphaera sp. G21_0 TaxID=2821094 RepID=UPI001ADC0029|nr:hypothetical protein [Salinisphaera sp. G21_0]MBO9484660.1 hypothetical protein [Salinisphaera sp. G21_0]
MKLDTITLPDDLLWINEFEWSPVEQSREHSLTGALLIQEQAKLQGRPIELTGGQNAGWVSRKTVLELHGLTAIPDKVMNLTLPDMRKLNVIFDRSSGSPISASPVLKEAYPDDNSYYYLSLRFITVT